MTASIVGTLAKDNPNERLEINLIVYNYVKFCEFTPTTTMNQLFYMSLILIVAFSRQLIVAEDEQLVCAVAAQPADPESIPSMSHAPRPATPPRRHSHFR